MELKVAFRKAVSADFKQDRKHLKIGQTYAISKDNNKTVNGIYSIKGDEDPFILKGKRHLEVFSLTRVQR